MPKRKHTKKQPLVACTDANQRTKESLIERARVAEAKQKKIQELRERYLAEMAKREEESKKDETPQTTSPTITPAVERDVANE